MTMNYFFNAVKDLYATYAKDTKHLAIYHRQRGGTVYSERMLNTEDKWRRIKIDGQAIDLNFYNDKESDKFHLMAYMTSKNSDGRVERVEGINQILSLEII